MRSVGFDTMVTGPIQHGASPYPHQDKALRGDAYDLMLYSPRHACRDLLTDD